MAIRFRGLNHSFPQEALPPVANLDGHCRRGYFRHLVRTIGHFQKLILRTLELFLPHKDEIVGDDRLTRGANATIEVSLVPFLDLKEVLYGPESSNSNEEHAVE